ncbi:hypothetical protein [Bdellovibrio sp. HCB337]|uniref:hypothetical protein n=1 Tax=Bdellovibrio sp. HCB337 TaxID=3394358 RepID=UPI0039A47A2C
MKSIILSVVIVLSGLSAFAEGGGDLGSSNADLPSYVEGCKKVAILKLEAQAAKYGATLDLETVQVADIDDRVLNPWKYVWFIALGRGGEGGGVIQLEAMTQKPPFQKCF